ncbi:hypothetical protein M0L39_RS09835 [Providencia rettgeri]|uniref:hypothetical protein n=1 Tax=Providencia rettgeri TaxID=587 RepID=UPI000807E27D|nr:hypothetical protein [Providencia rettgeri]EJD6600242.1 hypothetical protein [Providencia rettgeri]ELR5255751.1 hypothetical protein [Providencia rettgeri]MCL0013365.1 hypothetical protein [Providencia rettgeri]OBY35366.1 hypothetical protein PR729_22015 [Providencia rettgeri]
MSGDRKWAANIAFVGSKDKVKKILEMVEQLDDAGEIEDYTGIDGPYDSLQLMLKRRVENLSLQAKGEPESPQQDGLKDESDSER